MTKKEREERIELIKKEVCKIIDKYCHYNYFGISVLRYTTVGWMNHLEQIYLIEDLDKTYAVTDPIILDGINDRKLKKGERSKRIELIKRGACEYIDKYSGEYNRFEISIWEVGKTGSSREFMQQFKIIDPYYSILINPITNEKINVGGK